MILPLMIQTLNLMVSVVHKVPVATLSRVGLVSYIIKVEEVTVLVWTI